MSPWKMPTLSAFFVIVLMMGAGYCTNLHGQSLSEGSTIVDSRMDFKGHEVDGPYFIINYKLPYSGIVEIRLFNEGGEKIWQNQYINSYGENRIVLKANKFAAGENYAYVINYKQDEIRREFNVQ